MLHQPLANAFQGLVGTSPDTEPVGTLDEVDLIDRLQQHHYGPLQYLVLGGGDSDRPGFLLVLGNMLSLHWGSPVGSLLRSLQ